MELPKRKKTPKSPAGSFWIFISKPDLPRGLLGVVSVGLRQMSVKPAVTAIPAAERSRHRY